jgi:hypothetical protein
LKNPNKLFNAGSFGIPTVAYPELNFENEWKGYYLPANTMVEMIKSLRMLQKDSSFYKTISDRVLIKAEGTHIEKIAKLYENL